MASLTLCVHSSYLLGKIRATCTSQFSTRMNSPVQMDFTTFELLMRSGGFFKQGWQSFLIYLDSIICDRFCFLSQKLFVQIWLCVNGSGTNNCCLTSTIRCGLYPSRFVYLCCGSILRDAWLLKPVLNPLRTHILSFTLLSNTAEVQCESVRLWSASVLTYCNENVK